MKRGVLAGIAIVAAGGAVAWWRGRDGDGDGDRAAGEARPVSPGPAAVAPRAPVAAAPPVGPVAPSPPVRVPSPPAPEPTPATAGAPLGFDDEPRDPTWADEHEHELTLRVRAIEDGLEARGVAVTVGAPECRRSLCRLAIAAPDAGALGKLYGVLESEDGLHGWADALLLERVVTAADGRVETGVIAQFVRDEP